MGPGGKERAGKRDAQRGAERASGLRDAAGPCGEISEPGRGEVGRGEGLDHGERLGRPECGKGRGRRAGPVWCWAGFPIFWFFYPFFYFYSSQLKHI